MFYMFGVMILCDRVATSLLSRTRRRKKMIAVVWCLAVAGRVDYTAEQLKHEVKGLPGAPTVGFRQFSGYVDIPGRGRLFHWFVESASETPENDPILLWTNGGPGCSGLVGFLTENGPFRPTANGTLVSNPHAWNRLANMVYIEQPVGVGYSVANGVLKYSDALAAQDNLAFVKGFFKAFPQLTSNPFYLTSESYGGHYLPTLAEAIVADVSRLRRSSNFPFSAPRPSSRARCLGPAHCSSYACVSRAFGHRRAACQTSKASSWAIR